MNQEHQMYFAKIDVTKILKEHLFQGKGGSKYLDLVILPTPDSRYNDSHMICQSLPKELRDQGQRGPIIGNMKPKDSAPQQRRQEPTDRQMANQDGPDLDESVPF